MKPNHQSAMTTAAAAAVGQDSAASAKTVMASTRESLLGRQLHVGNIPSGSHWQDVKDLMRHQGQLQVIRVNILHHPQQQQQQPAQGNDTQNSYAIVLYGSKDDAKKAIDIFDGKMWQGRKLHVRLDESLFSLQPTIQQQQPNQKHVPSPKLHKVESKPPFDPENNAIVCQTRQVFVSNLPYLVGWQDLKDLFREAGRVQRADVKQLPANGGAQPSGSGGGGGQKSRGCGTVLFSNCEEAQRAIDMLNGFEWFGRKIDVKPDRHFVDPYKQQQNNNQASNTVISQRIVLDQKNYTISRSGSFSDVKAEEGRNSGMAHHESAPVLSTEAKQKSAGVMSFASIAQQTPSMKAPQPQSANIHPPPAKTQSTVSNDDIHHTTPLSPLSVGINSPISPTQPSPRDAFGGFPMWTSDTKHAPINIPQSQNRGTRHTGSSNAQGAIGTPPGFSGSAGSAGNRFLGPIVSHVDQGSAQYAGYSQSSKGIQGANFFSDVQQLPFSNLAISPPNPATYKSQSSQPRMPPPGFGRTPTHTGTTLGNPVSNILPHQSGANWPPSSRPSSLLNPQDSYHQPTNSSVPVPGKSTLASYLRAINQSQHPQ